MLQKHRQRIKYLVNLMHIHTEWGQKYCVNSSTLCIKWSKWNISRPFCFYHYPHVMKNATCRTQGLGWLPFTDVKSTNVWVEATACVKRLQTEGDHAPLSWETDTGNWAQCLPPSAKLQPVPWWQTWRTSRPWSRITPAVPPGRRRRRSCPRGAPSWWWSRRGWGTRCLGSWRSWVAARNKEPRGRWARAKAQGCASWGFYPLSRSEFCSGARVTGSRWMCGGKGWSHEPVNEPGCPWPALGSLSQSSPLFSPWPQGCLCWKPVRSSFLLTKSTLCLEGNTFWKTVLGKSPQMFPILLEDHRKITKRLGEWLTALTGLKPWLDRFLPIWWWRKSDMLLSSAAEPRPHTRTRSEGCCENWTRKHKSRRAQPRGCSERVTSTGSWAMVAKSTRRYQESIFLHPRNS